MEATLSKAVQLPSKEEHLKFCRESRDQNKEALRQYEFGGRRRYVNDVDVTLDHIASLRQIILDMDREIARLEADA